jgi:dihydropyrimidinase
MTESLDLVVHGGQVWIDGELTTSDIGVRDGVIAAIGTDLGEAQRRIDARGLLVLPGGIDVHTHFDTDVGGHHTADTFETGTRAAAFGGLTSIINYAIQEKGERLRDAIEREHAKASGQSYVDYSFHVIITDASVDHFLDDLAALPDLGCPSVKLFTAMDFRLSDDDLLKVLSALTGRGVMVNVHAEDGSLIQHLSAKAHEAGDHGIDQMPLVRPPRAEALAAEKMIGYAEATRTPLYLVHLSSAAALDAVRRGRSRGVEVYVETRPAYLFLDDSRYRLPDEEGNRFACMPPLRGVDDQAALWDAIADGEVDTYATDHTTWTLAQKMEPGLSFEEVPGGISNVQTSMGMLYSEGVRTGRLPLSRYVEVTSELPARLFGLWPRKGCIATGADADLVLLDPELEFRVRSAQMQSASDFDPYDGYVSRGWPRTTISRGTVVVDEQRLLAGSDHGTFLRRTSYQPVRRAVLDLG